MGCGKCNEGVKSVWQRNQRTPNWLTTCPIRDQRNRTLDRRATSSCKRAAEQNSLLKSESRMIGTAYANERAELAVCSNERAELAVCSNERAELAVCSNERAELAV